MSLSIANTRPFQVAQMIKKCASAAQQNLARLVHYVTSYTFLQIAISIPCLIINTNLFVIGFVVGFIFDKQVSEVSEAVNQVFSVQKSVLEKIGLYGVGTFIAILAMPTSLVVITLYQSCQLGAKLRKEAVKRHGMS